MKMRRRALCAAVLLEATPWPRCVTRAAAQTKPQLSFMIFYEHGLVTAYSAQAGLTLNQATEATLARLRAGTLREVLVKSHTDATVMEDVAEFTQIRANLLAEDLAGRGIPRRLIKAIGMGDDEPLVLVGKDVREPQNRRSEIIIVEQAPAAPDKAPKDSFAEPPPPPRRR